MDGRKQTLAVIAGAVAVVPGRTVVGGHERCLAEDVAQVRHASSGLPASA